MSHFEEIEIDRSEGWKYQTTLGNGDSYKARVLIDDDGKIAQNSYSREYIRKTAKEEVKAAKEEKGKGKKEKVGKDGKEKEGCLKKMIKAPFRFLWWLIKFLLKTILVILTLGIANGWFKDDK